MGVMCSCHNIDQEIRINNNKNNIFDDNFLSSEIIAKVIKLQSTFKGHYFRKKIKTNIKFQLLKKTSSDSVKSYKYPSIQSKDIKEIFRKYPLISQLKNLNLVLKAPYEMPNQRETYYGEWKGNIRCGRGIIQWLDGSRYEGYFYNDKANFKGKLFHKNGDTYEGEWLNDKANGFGIYCHIGGEYYEGDWKDDKQNGKGKETWNDGSCYEGDYKDGKRHGYGIFKWIDGSEYEGFFFQNMFDGQGKYTWNDKREYIGQWHMNQMDGYGIFRWPDGRKYEGDYKKDRKEGFGKFIWPDGRIFKGQWSNGKQHGQGDFFDPKKKTWKKGVWENGKNIEFYEKV